MHFLKELHCTVWLISSCDVRKFHQQDQPVEFSLWKAKKTHILWQKNADKRELLNLSCSFHTRFVSPPFRTISNTLSNISKDFCKTSSIPYLDLILLIPVYKMLRASTTSDFRSWKICYQEKSTRQFISTFNYS